MSIKKFGVLGIAAVAVAAFAGMASAQDASAARELYNTAGTHQFYVWCTGATESYVAKADGSNAEDAQMKAYNEAKSAGKTTCWPIWQGKVGG